MTTEEAREFKERWRLANDFIAEEVRNTPAEIKLQQLSAVFNSSRLFRRIDDPTEDDKVRARWCKIKDKLHA